MKIKEYFSHDIDASNDPALSAMVGEFKSPGYGVYWRVVEMLHKEGGWLPLTAVTYKAIARSIACDENFVRQVIESCIGEFKLFKVKKEKFTAERVLRNLKKRETIKSVRSEAGKRSAKKRTTSTNVQQMLTLVEQTENFDEQMLNNCSTNSNKEKERKEKERKEKERKEEERKEKERKEKERKEKERKEEERVLTINQWKLELLNNRHFIQQTAISWYLAEKDIEKMINDFAALQTSLERQWKDYPDFKGHFFSWGKYNNNYMDYQPKPKQMVH